MIAPDYGFKVNNFIGTYKIVELEGVEYIVSNEFYPAREGEKELERKPLFVQDFKKNDYLLLALANINIEKDEEIIEYCNKYGLPCSSLMALLSDGYTLFGIEMSEKEYGILFPLYRQDYIQRHEFCKFVIDAKWHLNLYNGIRNKLYNKTTLESLIYILLFHNIWAYNLDFDDPPLSTITGRITHNIQIAIKDVVFDPNIIEYKFQKIINCIFSKINDILTNLNFQKSDRHYIRKIIDFLKIIASDYDELISKDIIIIDENYDINFKQDISISSELELLIKEVAPIILADSINEILANVRPSLSLNDKKEFFADWNFIAQYHGVYMQLFLMCSSIDLQVRKCQNSTCEKFFTANFRSDKKYCCHECAVTAAKRRQRARDKADPDRARLEPGFQSKKAKK